jgi:uncharacterized membrane protein YraQ (UPF0718 family)
MRAILHALSITGSMTWEITWALILGFGLSAVIQAVVRTSTIVRLLGDDRPRTLLRAARIPDQGVSWDYTTWLNIVFLLLAAALITRFVRTGGLAMLRMMGGSPDTGEHMDAHASHRN